jgi:dolichol-phosphate mannosyltransferase
MQNIIMIPTYNERENLPRLLTALNALGLPTTKYLVVDDGSPDGTGDIADELARRDDRIVVFHRNKKDGLGRAYVAGFEKALSLGADHVLVIDADFSHDPKVIPELLEAAKTNDLVLGSRYVPGGRIENWSWLRRKVSAFGNAYARFVLGVKAHDLTTGYVCFSRRALEAINLSTLTSNGYVMNIEIKYRTIQAGFAVKEIPITFLERTVGKSKFTLESFLEAFFHILKLRFSKK